MGLFRNKCKIRTTYLIGTEGILLELHTRKCLSFYFIARKLFASMVLIDALSPQVEGKWSHSGGLIRLGTPQRGRPARPQLQSHLDGQKYTHNTQAHAHAACTHT